MRSGPRDVTIGIIAALPVEGAAMVALIRDLELLHIDDDPNDYRVGYLDSADAGRPHRVVLTTLPFDNTRNAATVSTDLIRTFTGVRCVVMCGIAGGIPAPDDPWRHVRLGDVVVAADGIVDYGHVRMIDGERHLRRTVDGVSVELVRAANELQVRAYHSPELPWASWLAPVRTDPMAVFARPPVSTDLLYIDGEAAPHPDGTQTGHLDGVPKVHHGAIGCADILLRDEQHRNELARQHGVLAVEMEGSGVAAAARLHGVPWFMVRGIVDYCENVGKSDRWHAYGSMAAAGYLRALLGVCRPFPVWRADPRGGALALLTDRENDRLVELFGRLPELNLHDLWRASAGDLHPLPSSPPASVDDLFEHLVGLNARADGVPPSLALVDAVAMLVGEPLATELRDWVDQTAARLHLAEVMARHRAARDRPEPAGGTSAGGLRPERPCLLIQITPDSIDANRCIIKYWIQHGAGPWRPEPGDATHTLLRRAERVVADALRRAETAWREIEDPVAVEFLLPTELLHLDVEWWRTELASMAPSPLCVDYVVTVRSLDRMTADFRRRVWANRWNALWLEPPSHRLYWGQLAHGGADIGAWDAGLRQDIALTSVVLSAPPLDNGGRIELELALRAGVPVVLWDRRAPRSDEATTEIRELVRGDPGELPERVRRLRVEAVRAGHDSNGQHLGRHLALLWDDPNRLIETRRSGNEPDQQ
jgi:nucleoside phosphorylase